MESRIYMEKLIFRQLFEKVTSTYTYIIADNDSGEACIIDPVFEEVERDLKLIRELKLKLVYAMNTHVHADHVTGTGLIKKRLKEMKQKGECSFADCQSVLGSDSGGMADKYVKDNEKIKVGRFTFICRTTPGHTNGCVTYILLNPKSKQEFCAFTGDALLIRGCGRTDFQQGNPAVLYDGVRSKILSLSPNTLLYPAHDYKGFTVTTVAEELKYNARLTKSKEEFIEIMNNLNLPYPKFIDKALPANIVCGIQDDTGKFIEKK
ncbi:hypothetical protein SNEBB_000926 [Seison nebaliae]|nr:hypothetical protein SNEBB_000926 [Seison nebaliae]